MLSTVKQARLMRVIGLLTMLSVLLGVAVHADGPVSPATDLPADPAAKTSHRLIVELESPPLSRYAALSSQALASNGRLNVHSAAAQSYLQQLEAEQNAFASAMEATLPQATVSTYLNEYGMEEAATYQIAFNGMAVDPGETDRETARQTLAQLPGVKRIYLDYKYTTDLYTSTHLINAPMTWNMAGGRENAGAGVKVASMDGGIHKDAPMFDGTGYTYPSGYPKGLTANTNGKIIASRVYFRTWDPPAPGDDNPWPGETGTPHGGHTSGIMAGDVVTASYLGLELPNMSGVAPKAYLMSYRVFYGSVSGDAAFYTAEGLAALEDIIADGAEVLNNSWGGGPGSAGGEFDPLDQALINASEAGIFVAMSNGNAGPGFGTSDHPSEDYINVAATTTSGTLAAGVLKVTAPEPISPTLQSISFGTAQFGDPLPIGEVITYTFATAAAVDPDNVTGCDPFPADAFDGMAAVISRGGCFFSDKVRHAQQAGATFAVVYNNAGDEVINMACGDDCSDITISSVFIGQTPGDAMVAWYNDHGTASVLELNTLAFQAGNEPDYVASFSSRGPGVGSTLKPDIAAPGVNILSQGYTPGATGEARHLGYGQASGTSMAAPHVAGAAALLRQLYPNWTNKDIKSALMSTAKYMEVYNQDGTPAQPLDVGAGRLDVGAATDPGAIFSPPSLSFGTIMTGTTKSMVVAFENVAAETETYSLSTLYTGAGFAPTQTTSLPGFTVSPTSVTVEPGDSAQFTVTFDAAAGQGVGDNQGYILLEGNKGHEAHLPAWVRVEPEPAAADVLLMDIDGSYLLGYPDYLSYYTSTLDNLGVTYDIWTPGQYFGNPTTIPEAAVLSAYDTIILFTGDYFYPDGTFTVSTPLTTLDMNRLTEYANDGGTVIAMGQDLAAVLNSDETDGGEFFYSSVLGGNWLQDSVSGFMLPERVVAAYDDAPMAFKGLNLHLGGAAKEEVTLSGAHEVPPVATTTGGTFYYAYNRTQKMMDYEVEITVGDPITLTAAHVHSGTMDVNGPPIQPIFPFTESQYITDTLSWSGSFTMTAEGEGLYAEERLYVNFHSSANPAGEVRAQLAPHYVGDGAENQYYVDELATEPFKSPDNPGELRPYTPLLAYPGPYNVEDGVVAMAHRDQPILERPGISYFGRSIYTSFGLEGINNGVNSTSRETFLDALMMWAKDEPSVTISDVTTENESNLTTFRAFVDSNVTGTTGVRYRWDFGDGTDYTHYYASSYSSHTYTRCGDYTVRVEAIDSWGNRVIGTKEIEVTNCSKSVIYLPLVFKNFTPPPATTLTLLHNNDGESDLRPGDDNFGGVAHFASVVEEAREDVGDTHPLLLVTSGDNFLAGPEWSASVEKGVPFYDTIALDLIGYDAMCLGNHDFDFGPDTLADFIKGFTMSRVPFLSANLDFSEEPALQDMVDIDRIAASVIVEDEGEQFGIVGATTPNLTFISSPGDVDVGQDVQAAVQAEIDALEAAGVNKVILISHLQGIAEDMALAPQLRGLDIMVAGGGDELLANPDDLLIPGDEEEIQGPYPMVVQNADGVDVPVVTTSGSYEYLGRLDVDFDATGRVIAFSGGPIRVTGGDLPDAVEPDRPLEWRVIEPVEAYVEGLDENVLATSEVALDGRRSEIRSRETNEGDLIADSFLWKAEQIYADFGAPAPDVAMGNGGGIRNDSIIPAGEVTELDTFDMLPFPNFLTIVPNVTPEEFKDLLENAVSRINAAGEAEGEGTGRFAQIGGFSFTYDSTMSEGSRVITATLNDGTVMVEAGEIAATARDVNVVVVDFLARGGDEYFGGPPGRDDFIILGTSYQQALADYLEAPGTEGGLGGTIPATDYPEGGEGRIVNLAISP